jgi:hypothetical protein
MLYSPFLNHRRWIAVGENPSAPEFEPHIWNDAKPNDDYFTFVERQLSDCVGYRIEIGRLTPLDQISKTSVMFDRHSDKYIADIWGLADDVVRQWHDLYDQTFGTVQFSTNCYAYLWNDFIVTAPGRKQQVGYRSGWYLLGTVPDFMDAAESDGLKFAGDKKPKPKDDFYEAALFVKQSNVTGLISDYHWFRQDRDGTYSHKAGYDPARNTQPWGLRFRSPDRIDYKGYQKVGYFYVPSVA